MIHTKEMLASPLHFIFERTFMKHNALKGAALLFLGSIIWGIAFVAQSVGSNNLNAFAFNSIRNFIGVFTLLPVLLLQLKKTGHSIRETFSKDLVLGGLICGVALCIASNFQQMGIEQSTVGKSAFITTLYIVMVPLVGIFFKKKLSLQIWCSVILAMIGPLV